MAKFAPALQSAVLAIALATASVAMAEPVGFSVDSRGAVDNMFSLWRINLSTGESERVGRLSPQDAYRDVEALALSPEEQLFGADDDTNTLLRIRQDGFAFPLEGGITGNMDLSGTYDFGMSFDCSGALYVTSAIEQSLFTADVSSGALQRVGPAGALGAPITDLAIWGNRAYGIGVGSNNAGEERAPNLYRLDLSQPSAELIGPLGGQVARYNNAGLSFDREGRLWAITDRRAVGGQNIDGASQILLIDPASGQAAVQAETSFNGGEPLIGLEPLAIAPPGGCGEVGRPAAIPSMSPVGMLLLMLSLLLFGSLQFRRSC